VNTSKKLRKQRDGRIHRTKEGRFYRCMGDNRFVLAVKDGYGGWVWAKVRWYGDFEKVLDDYFLYFSPASYATYKGALEAGCGR